MANTLVKSNNVSKVKMHHLVAEVVQEVLTDPDFGMELTDETIKDLKESIKQKKEGKSIVLEEVLKKHKKNK